MRSLETSSFRLSLQTLLRNKSAFIGTIIVILYFVDALVMEVYPKLFGITQPNSLVENFSSPLPLPPSFSHPLGTTAYGIDLLTSILKAIKFDLAYSLAVVLSGAALGVIIGVISGYVGGALDEFLMRITDIVFSIPYLVLALAVGFVIGRTYTSMVLALAIVWWPLYARYGRALTLSIKTLPYVDSARLYGMNGFKILLKHVIPNVLPPVFVQISLDLGTIMPTFSTLSFIGFIPNANLPELGFLTTLGLNYIQTAPWTVIFPGLAITVFSLAANLMGEGLRDVFDPRRRSE
jgi:peptide/nickel transport system permease protein